MATVPELANHPDPWSVLSDATRTLITLATALLGLTATFAQHFVEDSGKVQLGVGWLFLVAAIVGGIYTIGDIHHFVRDEERSTQYGSPAVLGPFNVSFVALVIGTGLIAWAAWEGWGGSRDVSIDEARRAAINATLALDPEWDDPTIQRIVVENDSFIFSVVAPDESQTARVILSDRLDLMLAEILEGSN